MFPNLDPKRMNALMRQMGMSQVEIDALRVVIEKPDGKIIINNPSVMKIKMQGQESFQISGETEEFQVEEEKGFNEEDVKTLIENTGCSEQEARNALEETGDLAEALIKLSN
jgi:nascent polypeptide-associated complex subunit alpha